VPAAPPAGPLTLRTDGPDATLRLGRNLGAALADRTEGAVVLLSGDLGAGKTLFVRGLGEGLRCTTPVKSPTFALEHVHEGARRLHHLDLYRLSGGADLDELGLEELFAGPDVVAIEWPDRLGDFSPAGALRIAFEADGDRRVLTITGPHDLVAALRGDA
jgi:tRNA threonylcarbamoyladenosine biosynthesis protein TsaE